MSTRTVLLVLLFLAGGCSTTSAPSDDERIPGEVFLDRPVNDINEGVQIRLCDGLYRLNYIPELRKRVPALKKKCHDVVLPALLDFYEKSLQPDMSESEADTYCGYANAALALEPDAARKARFDAYCCHHPTGITAQACLGGDWVIEGKVQHRDYLHGPKRQ
jgi:hypothetical protein